MKRKIFIVEDDADVRESLIMLLEAEGYDVGSAEDGLDAFNQLSVMQVLPHLIILDWMMPRMDGAQFYQKKKDFPHIEQIPLILLTADGRVQEKSELIKASVGLAKPIEVDTLLSAIEKHIA